MFSEAKKTVDYGFRRYRYLLAPYSLHTRARTNILGGLVIDWKLIQQTHTINDKMNYCMGGKFFQVQLRLLCPPDTSGTIKCSPPNKGQDKKFLVIKCLPWNIPTKSNLFLQAKWGDHAVCVANDRKVNEKENLSFNQLTHVLALAAGTPTSTSMPVRRTWLTKILTENHGTEGEGLWGWGSERDISCPAPGGIFWHLAKWHWKQMLLTLIHSC